MRGLNCWERDEGLGLLHLTPYLLNTRYDYIFMAPLVTFWWCWSGPLLNVRPLVYKAMLNAVSSLTARFSWLTTCFVGVKTVHIWLWISCQYIILITPTCFPSGSQFTGFVSFVPFFTQVHILLKNPQLFLLFPMLARARKAWLEHEFAYYDVANQNVSQYTTGKRLCKYISI